MRKVVKGICPVLNKEVAIDVEYCNASDLNRTVYAKGRFSCDYTDVVDCNANKCPLYEKAPQNI